MILVTFFLALLGQQISDAFLSTRNVARGGALLPVEPTLSMALSPKRELFFEIVASGLKDRFDESQIPRIFKFCQYAKGEIPFPSPTEKMHEPCEEFIDGLTAKPWWEGSEFDWVPILEAQSQVIADELQSVLDQREVFKGDSRYMATMGGGWTAFRLQRMGEWNAENVKLFPKTTEIVKNSNIPLAVRGVMFAKQQPRSGVQAHSDGRNFILTAHLGLKLPKEGCYMTVAGDKRPWKQNGVVVIDTSFTHETENASPEERYVLIVDFWHPELSKDEQTALEFIYDCRNKYDSGKVQEIDCTYVNTGNPTDVKDYVRAKQQEQNPFANLFNPFKK